MRTIKNEDVQKMIIEIREKNLSYPEIASFIARECFSMGGNKGLSSERIRQIHVGEKPLGAGSILYEKAIKAAHRRLCKWLKMNIIKK